MIEINKRRIVIPRVEEQVEDFTEVSNQIAVGRNWQKFGDSRKYIYVHTHDHSCSFSIPVEQVEAVIEVMRAAKKQCEEAQENARDN